MSEIKFGTDGWRAIMAEEFTFGNVRMVAQAIARYLNHHGLGPRGVVLGYDTRFLSEDFARAVAEVLMGNQIPALYIGTCSPTPVTAYVTTIYQAAGAVMLTASHNPPQYNGIKFIPDYGGPAMPEITDEIERYLQEIVAVAEAPDRCENPVSCLPFEEGIRRNLLQFIDPRDEYLKHLEAIIDLAAIRLRPLRVVVDPMYGCGMGYLERLLRDAGCEVFVIHGHRDPMFGGLMPEPGGRWLQELQEAVMEHEADLGLATDGDADRFGIVDRTGQFYNANQALYMLLDHLLRSRPYRGPVARTVATTHMLDRIAARFGLPVEETAVGFKYIGESLRKRGAILGGEESGGMSMHGHIPEKDGILACALFAEMVAVRGQDPAAIEAEILVEYGTLHSERLDLHTTPADKERIARILTDFNPREIAGYPVREKRTVDGLKLLLEGDRWVLIRASGTEPMFRLYVEAPTAEEVAAIQQEVRKMLHL